MIAAVALLLVVDASAAHVGQDQFGRFPFVVDGVVVGGGTSWGLVRPAASGGYERVCEESFGRVVFFAADQGARGALLGGTDGLARSADGGCTYDAVDNALAGEFVDAAYIDPRDPAHLIIATSTPNADNAIWESTDFGDTFTELRAPQAASFFDIAVSDDGTHLAVSGADNTGASVLLLSTDSGASFIDASAVVVDYPVAHALLFDGPALIVGGLQANTQGFVDRVTVDGGVPARVAVGTLPREVKQAALFRDTLYVIANNGTRGELFVQNESALGFGVVDGGPSDCIVVVDDILVGCGKQVGLNTAMFLTSEDAVTWTKAIDFLDVHYQLCPEGTPGRDDCSTFVELLCSDDVDNDFSGGVDCDDVDCDTSPACAGEGEGEAGEGEGEGDAGEGEGEGEEGEGEGEADVDDAGSCCTGSPAPALALGALALLRRRRQRR